MKPVSDDRPNVFQNLGNGLWFYNCDFERVDQPQEVDQENVSARKSWGCESIRVWGMPASKTVKGAIISNAWDMTQEIDLTSNNKRFELGISEDRTL